MRFFTNHCWCSDSNWGGHYDCRYILNINKVFDPEFDKLILCDKVFDQKEYDQLLTMESLTGVTISKQWATHNTFRLRQEPIAWLNQNVKDRKGEDINKGWAIGTPEYCQHDFASSSFDIFFHRKQDLMNFVKAFSQYKKPTHYFDYFKDERKELNLETLQYS